MPKYLNRDQYGNITKTFSRQGGDQKRQFEMLQKLNDCSILSINAKFMWQGNVVEPQQVFVKNSKAYGRTLKDIDAIITENNMVYPISCRYIGKDEGTHQKRSLEELFDWIEQCPSNNENPHISPIIFYGGEYFFRKRREYHNYQNNFELPKLFTTHQVLNAVINSKNKRCSLISEAILEGYLAGEEQGNITELLNLKIDYEE